jgi:hypothetical protein
LAWDISSAAFGFQFRSASTLPTRKIFSATWKIEVNIGKTFENKDGPPKTVVAFTVNVTATVAPVLTDVEHVPGTDNPLAPQLLLTFPALAWKAVRADA